jgi:creatinine amidohydrolase
VKAAKNNGKNDLKLIQLEELSWKQIEALDREKTLFFIPLSPLEEHGPHLPVGTDFLTARDAVKEAIKLVNKRQSGLTVVMYPSIPLGYAKITTGFPGTVTTHVKTITSIVNDTCCSLAQYGFKYFVICTFHMDLGHLKGIYRGIRKATGTYPGIRIAEPWGPYFYRNEVEQREPKVGFDTSKEVHGDFRETSLMKYQYPYLVDPSYKELPSVYRDLYSPRVLGKTLKDIGVTEGYVGSPAQADSDYGRWFFQQVVETFAQGALDLVEGKPLPELPKKTQRLMRSMFWV